MTGSRSVRGEGRCDTSVGRPQREDGSASDRSSRPSRQPGKGGDRGREIARLCCRRFFSDTFVPSKGARTCPSHSPENIVKSRLDRPSPPGSSLREHRLLSIPRRPRRRERPRWHPRSLRSTAASLPNDLIAFGLVLRRSFRHQERSRASRVSGFNITSLRRLPDHCAGRRPQRAGGCAAAIALSADGRRASVPDREPATHRSETTAISQSCERADAVVAAAAG